MVMVKDFKAGSKIIQPLVIRVQKIGNSSNGGLFARGLAEDNSGRIPFICFDALIVEKMRALDGLTAFMVAATVDINKFSEEMALQLVLQRLDKLLPQDDIKNLLPHGNFNKEVYITKLGNYIKAVRAPHLRSLLENIFSGDTYNQFLINPAGTKLHHAYLGGLLQHSVDVAGLALAIADQCGSVDKDLVISGALLHDIGKLREISYQIGFPYTDSGRLLGHISQSLLLVQEAAQRLKIPQARLERLYHILLAHHGDNEKGSPIACATKEAFIVHYADELNAIINQFDTAEGETKDSWLFNRMLQRNLYLKS